MPARRAAGVSSGFRKRTRAPDVTATNPALQQPDCRRCQHYFITYEPAFPNGCRALGFKSRALPHREVLLSSGIPCIAYTPRERL